MNTLQSLIITLLLIVSSTVIAHERTNNIKTAGKTGTIAAPDFIWGSPEDINDSEIEALKTNAVSARLPEFVWGSPHDIDIDAVELLKDNARTIPYPAFIWGDPGSVNVSDLKQ